MPAQTLTAEPRSPGRLFAPDDFTLLDCLVELRPEDTLSGVQFRDCAIDYTACPNQRCIKKLV